MKLLNLACGGIRPRPPWINLDCLHSQFPVGTPERTNLDRETNYRDFDLLSGPFPFEDDSMDGVLASHFIEHLDCMESVRVLAECKRILKPVGIIMVSVPDASYFRKVASEDTRENAQRLFGEPIINPNKATFRSYGLFFEQHRQILTEDAVWALLMESGFNPCLTYRLSDTEPFPKSNFVIDELLRVVNRAMFSVIMVASK